MLTRFLVWLLPSVIVAAAALGLWSRPAQAAGPFEYLSPRPHAQLVSAGTTIALRHGDDIDAGSLSDELFAVTGAQGGTVSGVVILADDGKTVIFRPDGALTPSDTVTVSIKAGIRTTLGTTLDAYSYSFTVSPLPLPASRRQVNTLRSAGATSLQAGVYDDDGGADSLSSGVNDVSDYMTIPDTFPMVTVTVSTDKVGAGYLFLSTSLRRPPFPYLQILDNGEPVYYKALPSGQNYPDFKRQPTGKLSYFDRPNGVYRLLDETYRQVGTIEAGNGYQIDSHGIQMDKRGHVLLQIYDEQPLDMSQVVAGGMPTATVVGSIVQELDPSRNVIFQWRSWDHFAITDASDTIDLTEARVDATHINSVEWDDDGNILLSNRHLDEITKIDRHSADVIWRMGGKQNQFTFVNEDRPFSHQHDVRRIANGNITMYDNGNTATPQYSRAVEYQLDEEKLVATKVWEYRNQPQDIFGMATGSAQRLPNGNTLIAWGGLGIGDIRPVATEVTEAGEKAFEIYFKSGASSYRAFRDGWEGRPFEPPTLVVSETAPDVKLHYSWNGATHVASYRVYAGSTTTPTDLVDEQEKAGFESSSVVAGSGQACSFYRVLPIDQNGNETSYSNLVFAGDATCDLVTSLTPNAEISKTLPSSLAQSLAVTSIQATTGTVSETATLIFQELTQPIQPPPPRLLNTGIVFDLDAQVDGKIQPGFPFRRPVTLTLSYDDQALIGLDESAMEVYSWDPDQQIWHTNGLAVVERDAARNRFQFTTDHLSQFALFAPAVASLDVVNVIQDGSFEAEPSNSAWGQVSSNGIELICDPGCDYAGNPQSHTGNYWVFFGTGGLAKLEEATIRQQVTISPGKILSAMLSFWVKIVDPRNSDEDALTVSIDDTELFTVRATDGAQYRDYKRVSLNVLEHIGSQHTLNFDALLQAGSRTGFYLDDVALTIQQVATQPQNIYLPALHGDSGSTNGNQTNESP